jgi:hypothetical protein
MSGCGASARSFQKARLPADLLPVLSLSQWIRIARGIKAKRSMGYTGVLEHDIVVPSDADGRPGSRLVAPSRSPYLGVINSDGSRSEFVVLIGASSALQAVCFGPADDRRNLESRCELAINSIEMIDAGRCIAQPTPATIAGLPALTYKIRLTRGRLLIEWKFDCQGWYFGAGIVQSTRDGEEAIALGLASLATWTWT